MYASENLETRVNENHHRNQSMSHTRLAIQEQEATGEQVTVLGQQD